MLIAFVLFPIVVASLLYIIKVKHKALLLLLIQFVFFLTTVLYCFHIYKMGPQWVYIGNYQEGLCIYLYADLLTASLCVLTTFLFLMMFVFNYHKLYNNSLFMFLFLCLQGLINGLFLSQDLFNLYLLIEVSTLVVSILIMFKKDAGSIYDGMIYLLSNIISMLFFLMGIGFMYKLFGSLNLHELKSVIHTVPTKELYLPYGFLITGVALKSAVMPLFSWLPRAHGTPSAPSSVSAILSGLYIKGGVILFMRIQGLFQDQLPVNQLFVVLGFLTAIIGFVLALSQYDLKLILAYHTVSQIGLIIFGLSTNLALSVEGSLYHIFNHAVFKSTLFLCAGMIIDTYGTRDLRSIKGVLRNMPFVSTITLMAIFGITGAPFFNGSISKYFIQAGMKGSIFEVGMMIINLGTVMSFVKFSSIFFGESTLTHDTVHPITTHQRFAIATLGITCLVGGLMGLPIMTALFGKKLYIKPLAYGEKIIFFLLSLGLGYLFYTKIYNRVNVFKKIRSIELSFNAIVMSMFIFFMSVTFYLYIGA